jgi:uncharacterized repeat protein (TIGR03803 family)
VLRILTIWACGLALSVSVPLTSARASSFEVLYTFIGGNDGGQSVAGLIADKDGNLYGTTTSGGGTSCQGTGCGTIFKVAPDGTETILHAFTGGSDGAYPNGALIADTAGNLYGTTENGGAGCDLAIGCGTVFRLAPDGTETVLHAFVGGGGKHNHRDGGWPEAGLIADATGNLYGTTYYGGRNGCLGNYGCGTVFMIAPDGTETILHTFRGHDGAWPQASLVMDNVGNLYGTTFGGARRNGCHGCGAIFKLAPDGTETVLHAFGGGTDGEHPGASLIVDDAGNLYGTSAGGGRAGLGYVFMLAPDGIKTVLHSFKGGNDGWSPYAGLAADGAGNLYGTTYAGGGTGCGGDGCGTIFKLKPNGSEKILYAFQGGTDGSTPMAPVALVAGNLYGTTEFAGIQNDCEKQGCGTVFTLSK